MTDGGIPGFVVAAPASGTGKTILTLALLRHFRNSGLRVGSFKVGPDYIDPMFHAAASGVPCQTLDPWTMRPEAIDAGLAAAASGADIVIGEGVMGLFDGAGDGSGSTADLAERYGLSVLLVVDTAGQAASAAAIVHGFSEFRPDLRIAGAVFNRIGGARHRDMLQAAMADRPTPLLGCLPRDTALSLPERHLGLVQAVEHPSLDGFLDDAATTIAAHIDMAALPHLGTVPVPRGAEGTPSVPALGQRIAVASDDAFAFAYPHVIEGWRRSGAELILFSPLVDEPPPDGDAVYLPGGYPELYAGRLAGNRKFLGGLREAATAGRTIYGECGGYMVLGSGLVDENGVRHEMAGLLPLETSFAERKLHLGYRDLGLMAAGPLGVDGAGFRGHEFHYSTVLREEGDEALFRCRDSEGRDLGPRGRRTGSVFGSFMHLVDRMV